MNSRSLAGNTGEVVEPLGSGAFMEEVGHWGQALNSYSLAPRPHFQSAFCFRLEDVTVCLLLRPPSCHLLPCLSAVMDSPFWNHIQNENAFFHKLLLLIEFYPAAEKQLMHSVFKKTEEIQIKGPGIICLVCLLFVAHKMESGKT